MPTVLLVDDELPIRQLVARVLERKGYTVISCGDATSALAVTAPFDLLLVDLILPDLNGRQLTEQLRQRQPDVPVILMSGYLPQHDLTPAPPSTFMQKPMTPKVVLETVGKYLQL